MQTIKNQCKKCNHSPMVLSLENDSYYYRGNKVELKNLPVFVCPKCNHRYYPENYKELKNKQLKQQAANLINYNKYLTEKELVKIREDLGLNLSQMDPFISAPFGSYKRWEGGEKIPAAYNIILKLIQKEIENGNNISILEYLKKERYWWKK